MRWIGWSVWMLLVLPGCLENILQPAEGDASATGTPAGDDGSVPPLSPTPTATPGPTPGEPPTPTPTPELSPTPESTPTNALTPISSPTANDEDGDGYAEGDDCNDADGSIHPGMVETCDGLDQDCDGAIDEGVITSYYPDNDGDGYGSAADEPIEACTVLLGYAANGSDCDDEDALVHPALVAPDSEGEEVQGIFGTIQTAVDWSLNCDLVQVMPGIYAEAVVLGPEHSGLRLESLDGPEQTSIESGAGLRPLAATGLDDWLLDGFTLVATEPVAADGAALYVGDARDVVLENLRVLDSQTSGDFAGGGVAVVNSDAITVKTSYFNGNSGAGGGALAVRSSMITVSDTVFQQNSSRGDGGAIEGIVLDTTGVASELRLERVQFLNNEAAEAGGAVSMALDGELEVFDSYFYQNASQSLWGGALYNPTHVERCTFIANLAVDGGISAGYGGAVIMIKSGDIQSSIFIQNSAVYAGAIEIWDKSDDGDSTFSIVNNTLVDNDAAGGFGHAVNFFSGDTILFRNNVVYGVGVEDGTTVFSWEGTPEWTIDHNDFFVDGGTILGGSGLSDDILEESGNIQADPEFNYYNSGDPTDTDCHLATGSPCIDTGATVVGTDPDGTLPDMGAYGGPGATW